MVFLPFFGRFLRSSFWFRRIFGTRRISHRISEEIICSQSGRLSTSATDTQTFASHALRMEHSDRAKHPPSVVVGIGTRSPVIEEVGGIKRRIDGSEGDRSLVEVETIGKVVGRGVGIPRRSHGENLFDEFKEAAET